MLYLTSCYPLNLTRAHHDSLDIIWKLATCINRYFDAEIARIKVNQVGCEF